MVKETLTIIAEARVADAQAQITALEKRLDSLTKTGARVSTIKGHFGGFTKSIVKAGIVLASLRTVTYAFTSAIRTVANGFNNATKASDDFQGAVLGLESVVGKKLGKEAIPKAISEVEKWQKTGLFTTAGVSTAMKNFVAMGYSVEEASNLVGVFADSAAFGRQRSLEFEEAVVSASEGVKNGNSILSDNAGITKNLSVILKEAGFEAKDLSRATSDVNVRQALYNGLMKEGSLFTGDFIRLQQTQAGQSQKVGAMMELTMSKIGKSFDIIRSALSQGTLEFLGAVTDIFSKEQSLIGNATMKIASYVIVIIRLMGTLLSFLPIVGKYFEGMRTFSLKPLNKSLTDTSKNSDKVSDAISGIGDSAKKAKKDLLGLASFDVVNVLAEATGDTGGGGGGVGNIGAGLDENLNKSIDAFNEIVDGANDMADKIIGKFTEIWKKIEPFVMPIKEFFETLFQETFGDPRLKGLWTFLAILGGIAVAFLVLTSPVGAVIVIITGLLLLVGILKESFFVAIESIKKWWASLPQKFQESSAKFKGIMDTWKGNVGETISKIKGFFGGLWESAVSIFTKIGDFINGVFKGIKDRIGTFIGGSASMAGSLASSFKTILNSLIGKINRGLEFNFNILGNDVRINPPDIPYLAQGGIISSPTVAMVGESGREAVMPLENNTGWIDELASKINSKGGGSRIIRIDVDGKKIAQVVVDELNEQSKLTNSNAMTF